MAAPSVTADCRYSYRHQNFLPQFWPYSMRLSLFFFLIACSRTCAAVEDRARYSGTLGVSHSSSPQ